MKKQTAVEWLVEQINYDNSYGQRWVSFKETTDLNIYFESEARDGSTVYEILKKPYKI